MKVSSRRKRPVPHRHHACRKCQKRKLLKSVLARLQAIQDLVITMDMEFLQHCELTLSKFEDAESNGPALGVRCSLQYMCLHAKYYAETKGIYKHAKDFLFSSLVEQYWALRNRLYRYKKGLGPTCMRATEEEMKVLQGVLLTDEPEYKEHRGMYVRGWKEVTLETYSEGLSSSGTKATADERRDVEEVLRADVENVELFEALPRAPQGL